MGSAIIKSNLGAGRYQIELVKSEASAVERKKAIEERQIAVDTMIVRKEAEVEIARINFYKKTDELNVAMSAAKSEEELKTLQNAVIAADAALVASRRELGLYKLEKLSLGKKLEQINTALTKETAIAWCADLSTELTGSVGTLEINGEVVDLQSGEETSQILVMPGGATGAGILQHPLAMTPAGVFVNLAKLPAWQKWKPTYRKGIVVDIEVAGNKMEVALGNDVSSAEGILINRYENEAEVSTLNRSIATMRKQVAAKTMERARALELGNVDSLIKATRLSVEINDLNTAIAVKIAERDARLGTPENLTDVPVEYMT